MLVLWIFWRLYLSRWGLLSLMLDTVTLVSQAKTLLHAGLYWLEIISPYGSLLNSMKNIYLYFIYLPACNPPSLEVWFQKCHTTKVIAMDLWDCRIVHNAMVNPLAPGGHFYKMWTFQKGDDKMYDFGFVCYVTQTTKPHCKVDFKSSKNFYQIWILNDTPYPITIGAYHLQSIRSYM